MCECEEASTAMCECGEASTAKCERGEAIHIQNLRIAKQYNGGEHSFLLYYVTSRIFAVQDLVCMYVSTCVQIPSQCCNRAVPLYAAISLMFHSYVATYVITSVDCIKVD